MSDREKSLDFVQDTTKLLVTLSTSLLVFSVAFSKELDGFKLETYWDKITISVFYVLMFVSLGFGIWTLLGLTTVLEPKNRSRFYSATIRDSKIKKLFAFQIIVFGAAVLFFILFGLGKIINHNSQEEKDTCSSANTSSCEIRKECDPSSCKL